MPTTTGPAEKVWVANTVGKLQIRDESDNQIETFVLFAGAPADASERIRNCMYLALAKDAVVAGKRVAVLHPNNSAKVDSLTVLRN